MKITDKIKLWMSIINNGQIYKKDPTHSIDHCLSWLLTHKVFDIKYQIHDSDRDYKLCEYSEIKDKTPYHVCILFGDDDTDRKYILKIWNVNRWYAFGNEGSVSFWPNYSDKDGDAYIIHNWNKCVPKKSIVYKLAKLLIEWEENKSKPIVHKRIKSMIEWEENKSKSTDKPGANEN